MTSSTELNLLRNIRLLAESMDKQADAMNRQSNLIVELLNQLKSNKEEKCE